MMLEHHRRVLNALYEWTQPHGEMCTYIQTIAKHTGMERREARRIVRHLARKGHAELIRGLCDEYTGMMAGSGYCITREGIAALENGNG